MAPILQDLRHGARALLRKPGFTLVAAVTLALGIGGNTAMFSVVNGVLLRPLPFRDPDRLVLIWESRPREGRDLLPVSFPNLIDWKEQAKSFAGMAGFFSFSSTTLNLSAGGMPERIQAAYVNADLFPLLGVKPEVGRSFTLAEDRPPGERSVVLGHPLWQRRFGANPEVVGRSLLLDGESFTVIGVMPRGFSFPRFPRDADLWLPLARDPNPGRQFSRGTKYLTVLARLRPEATLAGARAEMDTLGRRLEERYADINRGIEVRVVPLSQQATGDLRPALALLLGAVGFVLLIACANVANLLLARAAGRRRELAIRAALGAGRIRIVRLLLGESLILALLGGGGGLLVAGWAVDLLSLLPYNPTQFIQPYRITPDQIDLDGRVLGFTLLLSLVTAVLFGWIPALQASRVDFHEALKEGDLRTGGVRRHPFSSLIVISEVALSLTLIVSAALLVESFRRLERVPPAFNPESVLTFDLALPRARYPTGSEMTVFAGELLERLRGLPGVRAAGAVEHLPLSGEDEDTGFYREGEAPPPAAEMPHTHPRSVSPDYFRALGMRVRRGRAFTEADGADGARVAVINQAMARRFWPGSNPVGKRVALDFESMRFFPDRPPALDLAAGMREIVGVVADVRHAGLDSEPTPELYTPMAQRPVREMSVVLRGEIDPASLTDAVRREVRSLDPDQAVSALLPLREIVAASIARPRFNALLMAVFAGVALLLALVGVYGVVSHSASLRTHEIGIRMALGAGRLDVAVMILKEGLAIAAAGLVVGLAGALALGRLLSGLLFGVGATDPWVLTLASLLLGGTAVLACYLPAHRATKVDPVIALRAE